MIYVFLENSKIKKKKNNNNKQLKTYLHLIEYNKELFKPARRLSEARAFNELRRYHTRPSRYNWGPEMYIFWKRSLGTQISTLGFYFGLITEIETNTRRNFFMFWRFKKHRKMTRMFRRSPVAGLEDKEIQDIHEILICPGT